MRQATYLAMAGGLLLGANFAAAQEVPYIEIDKAHFIHRQAYHQHIAENYDAALTLYKQSAAMSLTKSENAIGHTLAFDRENKHDYVAALPWFIRAQAPRQNPQGYGFFCISGAREKGIRLVSPQRPRSLSKEPCLFEKP